MKKKMAPDRIHLFKLNFAPGSPDSCAVCGRAPLDPIHEAEGWRREALQLWKNYNEYSRQMADFVALFEANIPGVKSARETPGMPLLCLALHHMAMNFHTHAGPKTAKVMLASSVDDLPKSYGNFGRPLR
jgi:hypothetical protein